MLLKQESRRTGNEGGMSVAKETVEARAVKIAARVMQADGLCRYDSVEKCRRTFVDEKVCEACIRGWLLSKARKELKEREGNG